MLTARDLVTFGYWCREVVSDKGKTISLHQEKVVMPRIDDTFLDCSIFLYESVKGAEAGEWSGGSGCLIDIMAVHPELSNQSHRYAVSNSHVVCPRQGRGASVIRLGTRNGDVKVLDKKSSEWVPMAGHDLAACDLGMVGFDTYQAIGVQNFCTEKVASLWNVGIGDDVFLVGRFVNHDGKQRNLPTVRFGNIAMMPLEPVYHPELPGGTQESYLVELRTRSGYSGSPVFAYRNLPPLLEDARPKLDSTTLRYGPWFLGIEWGHINVPNKLSDGGAREKYVSLPSGMSGVVPAWRLLELLNSPTFQTAREKNEAEKVDKNRRSGVVLD